MATPTPALPRQLAGLTARRGRVKKGSGGVSETRGRGITHSQWRRGAYQEVISLARAAWFLPHSKLS